MPSRIRPKITIGTFALGHLGDVLCASSLPRLLRVHHGYDVYVEECASAAGVFDNNPYVTGFARTKGIPLRLKIKGYGHLIQRLQQGFGLPIDPIPKPELYLTEEERTWAIEERAAWPDERPACILSPRAITDSDHLGAVDWVGLGHAWSEHCTVVQPVMTRPSTYGDHVASLSINTRAAWRSEPEAPGAIVYRDLPLRRYLALCSVADYYCGPPSGGSHVAAAFGLPSLVIVWRDLLRRLRFPVAERRVWLKLFLYPQHRFIAAEDMAADHAATRDAIRQMIALGLKFHGRSGTRLPEQLGVLPKAARALVADCGRRVRRIPQVGSADGRASNAFQPIVERRLRRR